MELHQEATGYPRQVVYATTHEAFERTTMDFVHVQIASRWGLNVNIRKAKGMAVGRLIGGGADTKPVQLEDGEVEMVSEFAYVLRKLCHK